MPYEKFYRFYDSVMGDRSEVAAYIGSLIERHQPAAKTILEIACGTGGILGFLSESYEVTGLDRSRPMLAIARKKMPHVRFIRQDMRLFRIAQRFDAIVCVFDSVNHALRFAEWEKIFRRVILHLKDNGLFVFDVNTIGKLQRLTEGPAWVKQFDRDLVIIKVGGARNIFEWNVKMFAHQKRDNYRLFEESITEAAFPMKRIVRCLRALFREVKVIDPEGSQPSDQSERLYFVCRAPRGAGRMPSDS